eukprot:7174638-Pyramimonas_sp.AAC.1
MIQNHQWPLSLESTAPNSVCCSISEARNYSYCSSHLERCCRFSALNWAPAVNRQPWLPPADS